MKIIATQQIGQAAPWQTTQTAALRSIVATAHFPDRQHVGRSELRLFAHRRNSLWLATAYFQGA